MADTSQRDAPQRVHVPFPAVRLLYVIGYAVVAWFVFWFILALALMQFVIVALQGRPNGEVKVLSLNLIQYLWEQLAFVTFGRDVQPFPIGPFPQTNATTS
jgi:hypothetical protein